MADIQEGPVEELLDGVVVRLPDPAVLRARGARRTARRRAVGAMATVVVVAAVVLAWVAAAPGGGDGSGRGGGGRDVPPADSVTATASYGEGDTPYKKDGVVHLPRAEQLPGYGTWHWRERERGGDANLPLGKVGLAGVGCPTMGLGAEPDSIRYAWTYDGDREAEARHRYVEFTQRAHMQDMYQHLETVLQNCGMLRHVEGATVSYTGPEGQQMGRLKVYLEHGKKWMSILETLDGGQGRR
ncbi:hypothetical protein ACQB60_37615 [Actinomycetota bacterium Odt1-20B]